MDYRNIAQGGLFKAQNKMDKAEMSAKKAKQKTRQIEEINTFLALRKVQNDNFKMFKERYNNLFSSPEFENMVDKLPSAREMYEGGSVQLTKNISMNFEELEKARMYKALQNEELDNILNKLSNIGEDDG
tara:strand:- start:35055 stop:35444 length:390 start_codon:yes stop_codon:yes gene_type:complete